MNKLDVIVLIIILIPALFGFKNGFLKGIFSLLGIIVGLFFATRYSEKLTSVISFLNWSPQLLNIISFVLIIVFTYAIFIFIAGKISRLNFLTRTIDRCLGIILGICKGLIIASLFLLFTTNTFNFFNNDTIAGSKFYSSVINIAPSVYDYVVKFFPDAKDFYEEVNRNVFSSFIKM